MSSIMPSTDLSGRNVKSRGKAPHHHGVEKTAWGYCSHPQVALAGMAREEMDSTVVG